ncbi:fatty acid desaturase [Methylomonas paludis]|uniref:Fatty acid desaturase n=1 Tax=Methylomonas paludis TaxID=1173101 RepID=A0A975RA48_9GAMM|nr:fatty acid desaturase [Methylomonas paludis]QWF70909.1 fatty acid desaturase [Methylomonas paludis]
MSLNSYQSVDREQLAKDISQIHQQALANIGAADYKHLKKMERWGKACSIIGYGTAWIMPNPLSALFISMGSFTRWTQVAHPVIHKGYDKLNGIPKNYTSKKFAQGWRRFFDWPDWMTIPGWHHEHDLLHHYSLGEKTDPNNAQHNMEWLRQSRLPMWQRYTIVALFAGIWKIIYYTPRTHKELCLNAARQQDLPEPVMTRIGAWSPFTQQGRSLWLYSVLPYTGYRFVVLPLLFLPIGSFAAISVLLNSIMAEIFTNVHSFVVMIPNHAGDDVMMFDEKAKGKGEFYLRQILGSVNYPTGSDFNDFFYGWLNYQIEHHLWPNMPLRQYQLLQPQVMALCQKHNIPYCQQSIFKRLLKAVDVMVGKTSMLKPGIQHKL